MASNVQVVTDPSEVQKQWDSQVSERDLRIKELEERLQSVEKTHSFQSERADRLEGELKAITDKHSFQKKRADKLEAAMAQLQRKRAEDETVAQQPSGDYVSFKGTTYAIIGDFRADNTFAEVKRGHCPEGVTLLAIDKPH